MEWMNTRQASHRLGVKQATLYAYVSRGLLTSHPSPDGRNRRFLATDIERLALRGRPRQASRSPSLDIDIATSITSIRDHHVRYRGHDVTTLATTQPFENVAQLLWTGTLPEWAGPWTGTTVQHLEASSMAGRLRLVAAQVAAADHPADHLDPSTVAEQGSRLIASIVDSLPLVGDGRCPRLTLPSGSQLRGTIAGRLWGRLTPRRATPELIAATNAALVLLADHEMAASTLAARVAASTRAGVHGVVAAGMGAMSGPMHGGESRRTRVLLSRLATDRVDRVVDDAIERYGRLLGFGQVLYPHGDPRFAALWALLVAVPGAHNLDLVERLVAEAQRRNLPPPNVDLGLAALGLASGMQVDAGEAIFTVARISGWLAHAMEEYAERPLRFRPRAIYLGAETPT